jgi:hypothetical protein
LRGKASFIPDTTVICITVALEMTFRHSQECRNVVVLYILKFLGIFDRGGLEGGIIFSLRFNVSEIYIDEDLFLLITYYDIQYNFIVYYL